MGRFDILATGQSDIHCIIKETLLIAINIFSSRYNEVCLFSFTFSLSMRITGLSHT